MAKVAIVAVVALVAAGLVAAGVAAARPDGAGSMVGADARATASTGAAAASSVETVAARDRAVQALLQRRAAALRSGDLAGWLADVDPQQPALVAHQRMLFANLRQLPLSRLDWAPAPSWPGRTSGVPVSVSQTLGDLQSIYSPWLVLTYQFAGFDAVPVTDAYLPIIGWRGGRWLLAGDQTQTQSNYRWVEPWDGEPIIVARGHHVLVVVSASDAGRATALVSVADQALTQVASMWPVGTHQAVLYATRSPAVFSTFLGSGGNTGDYDGLTIGLDDTSTARAQHDLRVVVNPALVPPGSGRMPALLRHEFTHVAKWADESTGTPLWASEGIAEYTAYRFHPGDQLVSGQLGLDASRGRLPRTLPSDQSFFADATGYYDYGLAWCTFEYISERYGEGKVRALYESEARVGGTPDSAQARAGQARGFQAVFGVSETTFMAGLDAWIKLVLRPAG